MDPPWINGPDYPETDKQLTKFQQQLMAAAEEYLRSSLALHTNCHIIIDEQLAKNAIDKHEAFRALVERAMDTELPLGWIDR